MSKFIPLRLDLTSNPAILGVWPSLAYVARALLAGRRVRASRSFEGFPLPRSTCSPSWLPYMRRVRFLAIRGSPRQCATVQNHGEDEWRAAHRDGFHSETLTSSASDCSLPWSTYVPILYAGVAGTGRTRLGTVPMGLSTCSKPPVSVTIIVNWSNAQLKCSFVDGRW